MNDGVSIAMRRKRPLIPLNTEAVKTKTHSLKHAAINFFNNLLKLVRKDNRLEFEYVSSQNKLPTLVHLEMTKLIPTYSLVLKQTKG